MYRNSWYLKGEKSSSTTNSDVRKTVVAADVEWIGEESDEGFGDHGKGGGGLKDLEGGGIKAESILEEEDDTHPRVTPHSLHPKPNSQYHPSHQPCWGRRGGGFSWTNLHLFLSCIFIGVHVSLPQLVQIQIQRWGRKNEYTQVNPPYVMCLPAFLWWYLKGIKWTGKRKQIWVTGKGTSSSQIIWWVD